MTDKHTSGPRRVVSLSDIFRVSPSVLPSLESKQLLAGPLKRAYREAGLAELGKAVLELL